MAARHLERSVPMLLSLSLCGLSLAGADVAGFMGDPDLELFVRWHQLGIWPPGITWCYLGMVGSMARFTSKPPSVAMYTEWYTGNGNVAGS